MTDRLQKRTTTSYLPEKGCVMINAGEIAARMVEFMNEETRRKDETAQAYVERCLEDNDGVLIMIDLAGVAAGYIMEQLNAEPSLERREIGPAPHVSGEAQ